MKYSPKEMMYYAMRYKRMDVLRWLCREYPHVITDTLSAAFYYDNLEAALILLENGAEVNSHIISIAVINNMMLWMRMLHAHDLSCMPSDALIRHTLCGPDSPMRRYWTNYIATIGKTLADWPAPKARYSVPRWMA